MTWYYAFLFFLLGTIMGSFYNVVGYRLPRDQSILYPSSHCPNCNHHLKALELIPIFSFFFQRGQCRHCGQKISWFYPLFEFLTGLLFGLSYLCFGFSWMMIISLIFVSLLLIVVISDYQTMIIPDEVLIFASILILIVDFFAFGLSKTIVFVGHGIGAFFVMFLLKKFGDFLFKQESMGGGDLKLLFVFGFVLGLPEAILTIFLGSIIGLPISLFLLRKNHSHEIPFGPFLSVAAMILWFTRFSFLTLLG